MKPTLDLGPSPAPGPNRRHEDGDNFTERREPIPSWPWGDLGNLVMKVGVPSAIALYLVYQIATAFPAKLDAHAAESRRDNLRTLRVLQQICVNTATPETRGACLSWSFDEK